MRHILGILTVLFYILSAYHPAYSGSSQALGDIYFEPERIIKFAKGFEKSLAKNGARVAIVARVGRSRDKLPEGINFTHTAIAVYSQITTVNGRKIPGYAIYNLYQRDKQPDISDLIQDYPVDFFSGVQVLEAGVIIPSPEIQASLLNVLISDNYKKLHNLKYSVISNPFTLDLQNCTEHTLDLLFSAIYKTNDIKRIKKNEEAYFEPQSININPIKLALGTLFAADVTTSDHPNKPVTATFTTIGRFLQKYDKKTKVYIIKEEAQNN
ncbi:MAG: DUF2145 domain-containing protein [Deltaproteobacteria bacterium]|nr:DUF2145 domain-containing protein [Deltaproteobacteria bacterium]